ncbi:PilN domain-containing protein [Neobacillus niacini]|uniref:PilN domain-containing protein n=1 Tax=Neobacillus niacini TaxID=86668 RepID=UPI00203A52E9|nr:PilN domain-containing protein [Neobacillus niacini]MCM3692252.1 PilN domain-containing protein [Neobacillus niacini]
MLVDINLLPQKERGKKGLIGIISIVSAIFLMIGGYYLLQIQSAKRDIANLESQIETTKKIVEAEQSNSQQNESNLSVTVLKNAVEWAKAYPIQTVPVMQYLTSLLPERGFIQSFSYTEAGTVSISVQFDSGREAAYFLDTLNESEWIDEVSLSSLSTNEVNVASNEATSQTGDGQTTTTNNNLVVTTDPNNPNNIIITTKPDSPESQNTVTVPTNKYVPRYIGQFGITFNKEAIKEILNKGQDKDDEEGVTAS